MKSSEIRKILRSLKPSKVNTKTWTFIVSILFLALTAFLNWGDYLLKEKSEINVSGVNTESTSVILSDFKFDLNLLEDQNLYLVTKVIDGDTIEISTSATAEKIRLIGIDTPETKHPTKGIECYGQEASLFLKNLILGERIYLVADQTQDNTDRYDRLLRYVILEDGTFVNYEILRNGYGFEYTYKTPYNYVALFNEAQGYAQNNNLGLWGEACN